MTPLLLAIADEDVTAGPIGLLIVGVLGLITFLLVRNMNGRIKRLPPSFPDQRDDEPRREDRET